MPKKILVLSAAVGAGHLRAAEAVTLALRQLAPDALVQNVDVLTLTNAAFRRVYGEAYLDLVNHAPHLLGYFYDRMDRPQPKRRTRDKLLSLVERLNLAKFIDLVKGEKWDVIVSTHFLPAEIVATLRKKRKTQVPQILVTTDFETHRLWVHKPVELYTTATEEGAAYLATFGVDPEKIRVTGITIHPKFSEPGDRAAALKAHELDGSRPIVLQLAGGFGVGPIEQLYRGLLDLKTPLQIVAVCGKNEKTLAKLKTIAVPSHHKAKLMGFTTQMDELLTAADLVLTKPGGLTTSEVLARGAAMAIVNPIPGQESRNSDYLLENGAAVKINNLATMGLKLEPLLADRKRLETLKANAKRSGHPQAAFDVAQLVLEMA